ncbi:hypothetical protein CRYUN_Cryun20dG0120400 [Craigia yunnanensis]
MGNPFHSFLRFFGVFVSGDSERISNKIKSPRSRVKAKSSLPEQLCRQFSLDEIRAATSNFDPNLVIGMGGSGVVYKGFIDDGTVVAFKRLMPESSRQKGLELQNEVQLLCQLHHQNLVSLIGFCDEKYEKILVYQHMSKGSLHDYLHGTGHDPLPWKQRLEICIGPARGLHYLHAGAKRAVIHRDIKTKNILLDDQWVSQLSDFGLSKIGPFSMSNAPLIIELPPSDELMSTTMLGTIGYLDPEFFINNNLVTDKADVYSFGIVLFEGNKRPALGEVEATLELALELQNKADSEMECINPHGEGMRTIVQNDAEHVVRWTPPTEMELVNSDAAVSWEEGFIWVRCYNSGLQRRINSTSSSLEISNYGMD